MAGAARARIEESGPAETAPRCVAGCRLARPQVAVRFGTGLRHDPIAPPISPDRTPAAGLRSQTRAVAGRAPFRVCLRQNSNQQWWRKSVAARV